MSAYRSTRAHSGTTDSFADHTQTVRAGGDGRRRAATQIGPELRVYTAYYGLNDMLFRSHPTAEGDLLKHCARAGQYTEGHPDRSRYPIYVPAHAGSVLPITSAPPPHHGVSPPNRRAGRAHK